MGQKPTLRAVFELSDNFSRTLKTITQGVDTAEEELKSATSSTQTFGGQLESLGKSGAGGVEKLSKSLAKFIDLSDLAKKGIQAVLEGVKTAATLNMEHGKLSATLGSPQAGDALYEYGVAYSQQSVLDQSTVLKGLDAMAPYTRDIGEMEHALKLAERLYMKDSSQGSQGAMTAVTDLLKGDPTAARTQYGVTGISSQALQSLTDFGSRLDFIDVGFSQLGITQELVDANMGNLLPQWSMLVDNLKMDWGGAMDSVSGQFEEFVGSLNQMQEAGDFLPIMQNLAQAALMFAKGLAWVGENLNWLLPLVGSVTAALIVYTGATAVFSTVTEMAKVIQEGFALTSLSTTLALIPVILAVIALVAALYFLTGGFGKAGNGMEAFVGNAAKSLDKLRTQAGDGLKDSTQPEVPVTVANPGPISVKGEVDIEDRSLQYLYDLAEERRARQYAGTTVNLQNTFGDIRETANLDEMLDEMLYRAQVDLGALPAG